MGLLSAAGVAAAVLAVGVAVGLLAARVGRHPVAAVGAVAAVGTVAVLVATTATLLGAVSPPLLADEPLSTGLGATVLLSLSASVALVHRIDGADGRWGAGLRRRFLMGVPWGTLVSVGLVLAVYLFVQGGLADPADPVTIPFRAWSYLYPLGVLTAAFAHDGLGHLVGNLTATVLFAPIAEYAWGHFPTERGDSSFSSLRTNPFLRAFVVFPAAVALVGLATAAFSIGPVIGFSGVVFAFAGFALVRYPMATVVATVGAGAVSTTFYALRQPIVTATPSPSPPAPPWWAGIAIQGHALGLFLGVILAAVVFGRRDDGPSAARLWVGVLLFAMSRALWAVYWFRGSETFVLFRGPGIVLVTVLAVLVTVGAVASDRQLLPLVDRVGRRLAPAPPGRPAPPRADGGEDGDGDRRRGAGGGGGGADDDRPRPRQGGPDRPRRWHGDGDDGDGGDDPERGFLPALRRFPGDPVGGLRELLAAPFLSLSEVGRRNTAVVVLLLAFGLLAGPGVAVNSLTVADPSPPGEGVEVRDYTVSYAEGVTNRMVAVVNVSAFNETTAVTTSGVVVTSERRGIWQQVVSTARLAFDGTVGVDVGGVGWRETVTVSRRGWVATGGGAAYTVSIAPPGGDPRQVFRSPPANASPVIAGRNVSVVPGEDGFRLRVERNGSVVGTAPVPGANESTSAGGLRFVGRPAGDAVAVDAVRNGTRVEIAREETYE